MEEDKIKYDFDVIRKGQSYLRKTMLEIANMIADHTMKQRKYKLTELPYLLTLSVSMYGFNISVLRRENDEIYSECVVISPSMNFALNRSQSKAQINWDKKAIMKDLNECIYKIKEAKELVKKYININEENLLQRKVRTA